MENVRKPEHIGFIMDGNRTWAKEKSLPSLVGHKKGYENAKRVITLCKSRSIPYASFWALSDDNIRERSRDEVQYLFGLLTKTMPDITRLAIKENLRIEIVGDRGLLPEKCNTAILKAEEATKDNTAMTIILAIGY